jgi:hypothetical protein
LPISSNVIAMRILAAIHPPDAIRAILDLSSAKMKSNQFVTEGDSHAAILCIW